jgi:hypothetical protein
MRRHRKSEEGAVLLLLIVMMSAVVLIVASLLRFNTQNIRFAAIEAENEQAMYLAEGVADSIDFYFLEKLADDEAIESGDISLMMTNYTDIEDPDYQYGLSGFLMPSVGTLVGVTALSDLAIEIINPDNTPGDNFAPDENNVLRLKITVSGGNSSRSIAVTYQFPTAKPDDGYDGFIISKELNYSNSL